MLNVLRWNGALRSSMAVSATNKLQRFPFMAVQCWCWLKFACTYLLKSSTLYIPLSSMLWSRGQDPPSCNESSCTPQIGTGPRFPQSLSPGVVASHKKKATVSWEFVSILWLFEDGTAANIQNQRLLSCRPQSSLYMRQRH